LSGFTVGGIYMGEGPMNDDNQMWRQFAEDGSETAFAQLVARYLDLVYCTALRKVGHDAQLAQEVAQTVFSDLARKARQLPKEVVLGGWLYHHTSLVSAQTVRTERRRRVREQKAMTMNTLHAEPEPGWEHLAPFLEEAMQRLAQRDRDAIVLRYFERRDLRGVSQALGTSEEAARKRVSRAVEKLRDYFQHHGVTLSAATLASLLAGHAVTAAPAGLAASITGPALASAAAAGMGIAQLITEVIATSKVKAGLVGVLCVAALTSPPGLHYQSEAQAQFARLDNPMNSTFSLRKTSRITRLTMATTRETARTAGQAGLKDPTPATLDALLGVGSTVNHSSESTPGPLDDSGQPWLMAGDGSLLRAPRSRSLSSPPQASPSPVSSLTNPSPKPDQSTVADRKSSGLTTSATDVSAPQKSPASPQTQASDPSSAVQDPKPTDASQPSATPDSPPPAIQPVVSGTVVRFNSSPAPTNSTANGPVLTSWDFDFTPSGGLSTNGTNGIILGGGTVGIRVSLFTSSSNLRISKHYGQSIKSDSVDVSWNGGPGIRLQMARTLTKPVWTDVPNSEGKSSVTPPMANGNAFFRLYPQPSFVIWTPVANTPYPPTNTMNFSNTWIDIVPPVTVPTNKPAG
jgi:RNA polymerase sigma factor (sigma-70 family)